MLDPLVKRGWKTLLKAEIGTCQIWTMEGNQTERAKMTECAVSLKNRSAREVYYIKKTMIKDPKQMLINNWRSGRVKPFYCHSTLTSRILRWFLLPCKNNLRVGRAFPTTWWRTTIFTFPRRNVSGINRSTTDRIIQRGPTHSLVLTVHL